MVKKLSMIGGSKGLILDKTLLGLLGIENDSEVSLKVEGRRLIVEPVYRDPLVEIRSRLADDQGGGMVDQIVNAAAKRIRGETVRKLRTVRGR